MTTQVVHLAPHYGGGVGTVLRALIRESLRQGGYRHRLASLEPVSAPMRRWAAEHCIELVDALHEDNGALLRLLAEADIVHVHWWHHPLLNALMHRSDLPAFRCVLWSHVNGHHAPQNFPIGLADYTDALVLASPWSLEAPALAEAVHAGRPIHVIQSSAGAPVMPERRLRADGHFRIGYVGTVDPIKMHPDFVRLCLAAEIPNARFVVAGGPRHGALQEAVTALGVADRFEILGPIDAVPALLATLDVFGYPLNPEHYGTGEQVLIEAMAAGVVPVVLDGGSERFTVEHERTGLVCRNETDYPAALHRLSSDRALLSRLSQETRESAARRFSIQDVVHRWHAIYDTASMQRPAIRCLPSRTGARTAGRNALPVELLLDALAGTPAGDVLADLSEADSQANQSMLRTAVSRLPVGTFSDTRGTPFHYRQFFPEDPALASLCRLLERHRPDDARNTAWPVSSTDLASGSAQSAENSNPLPNMNETARRPCPSCGHVHVSRLSALRFPLFNDTPIAGDMSLVSCARCGFVYYDTPSTARDFDAFYEHHYLVRSYALRKAHPAEAAYLDETVAILTEGGISPDAFTVDVGCGPGHLLSHLQRAGFTNVLGLELCAAYVEEMQAQGIPARVASAAEMGLDGRRAECLIFKNIFEHFLDFESVLDSIERSLEPGGHVFIEVPDASRYGDFPDYSPLSYLTLEHINHFDRAHLEALFFKRGFRTVRWGTRMLDIAEKFPVPIQHVLLRWHPGEGRETEQDFALRDFLGQRVAPQARFASPELEALRQRQAPTYVWGLSYRTLAWLGMSDLAECNIVGLFDSDERKQQRTLRGMPIGSPDSLKSLDSTSAVVIGVGPSSGQMRALLEGWGFEGEIIVLH